MGNSQETDFERKNVCGVSAFWKNVSATIREIIWLIVQLTGPEQRNRCRCFGLTGNLVSVNWQTAAGAGKLRGDSSGQSLELLEEETPVCSELQWLKSTVKYCNSFLCD